MIQIKRLDHVVIRARDAETLVTFYCNVLGCTIERRLSSDIGIVQLRAGEALIDIVAVDSEIGRMGGAAPEKEGRNMDHFCVRLESFDEEAIRKHLNQHSVVGSKLETRYGAEGKGPSIYIQDPEGNTIELKGPPSE
ncbi:MAG: lactoylglutathione lyase [Nitrospirales bacterium]|nr:MAG: lactoylglutathione lyase [Nitrospirales bacterium]